jgi:hypothetical protein
MAYRSDVDALEARHRALEAELAQRVRERDDVARMLAEARAQECAEHARIDAVMGGPMRRRRAALLVAVALLLITVAGAMTYRKTCVRSHDMRDFIERFQMFSDEVCRCRDTACTQRTIDVMTAWSTEIARQRPVPLPVDDASSQHMQRIAEQFSRCMTRIATGNTSTIDVEAQ